MELVTVPRVPVLRTGHFDLESGPADFTIDHLNAAARALANDPAVLPMRVRLELEDQAHLDGEGMAIEAAGGLGGPAIGWGDNYVVAGNTLYADLHLPAPVADAMEWAFPSRSIEGLFGYATATGHTHDFLATGLLLLGTSWPGVTTLPDFHEVQAEFAAAVAAGEVEVASYATAALGTAENLEDSWGVQDLRESRTLAAVGASGRPPKPSRDQLAAASLAVTDLGMRWYAAERDGDLDGLPESYDFWSWYVTEVRAEEDGTLFVLVIDEASGQFWRFDVTAINGPDVTFGEPSEVMLEVIPVSARRRRSRPALARWGSRADSRAVTATTAPPTPANRTEDEPMNDALRRRLATRHGLDPETATEDEILAAENATAESEGTPNPPAPEPDDGEGGGNGGEGAPEGEPNAATARTATVSTGRLQELERDAAEGRAARARQLHGDRDRLVLAALEDGRITPAESGLGELDASTGLYGVAESGWRRDLEDAPDVTARALARLEAGKYPGAKARQGHTVQDGGQNLGDGYSRARASFGLRRNQEVK